MLGRFGDDTADEIEAVLSTGVRDVGFGTILGREGGNGRVAHVRRIGQNEVVPFAAKAGEEIGPDQFDAIGACIVLDVALGDRERIG